MPVYLDHASTSWPKAPGVSDAMTAALELAGSPRRGGGPGARRAEAIASELRKALAAMVGERDPQRVVLTPGATHAIAMGIQGVVTAARMAGRIPRIVTTQAEHNAVRRTILALAQRGEVDPVLVPADSLARVRADAMIAAATRAERPAELVVMASASNVTGAGQPVDAVWEALRATGTLLLVDASQTAGPGAGPIAGDLVAFGAHKKFRGPPGVGALVVRERAHPLEIRSAGASARLAPVVVGGAGHSSEDVDMPAMLPERFEPATANTPAMAGWLAATRSAPRASEGFDARAAARHLADGLRNLGDGVQVFRPEPQDAGPDRWEPIVSFTIAGFAPDEAVAVLESEFGILVRAGLHCAPGAHEAIGTLGAGGTVRASLGETTTSNEVEQLIQAVRKMV